MAEFRVESYGKRVAIHAPKPRGLLACFVSLESDGEGQSSKV